jgi:hypothetical protein
MEKSNLDPRPHGRPAHLKMTFANAPQPRISAKQNSFSNDPAAETLPNLATN